MFFQYFLEADQIFEKKMKASDLCTDEMHLVRDYYWVGDWIRFLAWAAPRASSGFIKVIKPLIWSFCVNYIPDAQEVIGFRPATTQERMLSRFNCSNIYFTNPRLCRHNETFHVTMLVRTKSGRVFDSLFSASHHHLSWVEVLDTKRVCIIRYLVWVGLQLQLLHKMRFEFVMVWSDVLIPLLLEDDTLMSTQKISQTPWRFSQLWQS